MARRVIPIALPRKMYFLFLLTSRHLIWLPKHFYKCQIQCLIPHPQVIPQQQENYQLDPIHPLPKIYNNNNSHTRNNITNTNLNNNLYWNQNINAFSTVIPASVNNTTNNFYCPDLKSFNMINPMNNINYNIVY